MIVGHYTEPAVRDLVLANKGEDRVEELDRLQASKPGASLVVVTLVSKELLLEWIRKWMPTLLQHEQNPGDVPEGRVGLFAFGWGGIRFDAVLKTDLTEGEQ